MQHFDVVVIGREVAGLCAGALLAKSGARVLHLDAPNAPTASYKRGELTLFRRMPFFGPWDGSPAQKRVLFDLNLISELSRRLLPLEPGLQLALPGQRIDVRREESALTAELERESPGGAEALAPLLARVAGLNEQLDKALDGRLPLPPESWGERRRLKKALAATPIPDASDLFEGAQDHLFTRVVRCVSPWLSGQAPAADAPLSMLRAAGRVRAGFHAMPRGHDELIERLIGVITSFRGASRADTIEDVTTKWRRGIVSLRLGSAEVIGCEHLIGAEPIDRLMARLPDRLWSRSFRRAAEDLVPTHRIYTLNLGLRADGVPFGMGPFGVCVTEPQRELVEENALVWWHSSASKTLRGITLAALVPEADSRDRVYWRSLKERILGVLDGLMPFYRDHLEFVDVPWDDGESADGRTANEMEPVYAAHGKGTLGLTALGHKTPVRNLVLANRQILPALGQEGEFLAGIAAARRSRQGREQASWAEQ